MRELTGAPAGCRPAGCRQRGPQPFSLVFFVRTD